MPLILGFDPGGQQNGGRFGWCICDFDNQLPINLLASGVALHAQGAFNATWAVVQNVNQHIAAAGIDAPMFWRRDGDRNVDVLIRHAIAPHGATVQHVNSLMGACNVQGVMIGIMLRNVFHDIQITESHPKALLWLLDLENNPAANPALIPFLGLGQFNSEHERDAALGALGAWAMLHHPAGWQDLFLLELNPIMPVPGPMSYWMPLQ